MNSKVCAIKEVANILDIEAYVLRYYEKELGLDIHRNSQGHRIYCEEDINVLRQIKELREQGLELKAIKNRIHASEEEGIESLMQIDINKSAALEKTNSKELDINDLGDGRVQHFTVMMKEVMLQALGEYNSDAKEQIKEELTEEMNYIVNKKMREMEVMQKTKDEDYYNKIDVTIREMQKLQKEVAEMETKRKQKLLTRIQSALFRGKKSKNKENKEHVENLEHIESKKHAENLEHIESKKHAENLEHIESKKHAENLEHIESKKHAENLEHIESKKHVENLEHIESKEYVESM
ncbi:MAG: MerR family transcriptional regulator [Cellulosilyticaceae bacterium]